LPRRAAAPILCAVTNSAESVGACSLVELGVCGIVIATAAAWMDDVEAGCRPSVCLPFRQASVREFPNGRQHIDPPDKSRRRGRDRDVGASRRRLTSDEPTPRFQVDDVPIAVPQLSRRNLHGADGSRQRSRVSTALWGGGASFPISIFTNLQHRRHAWRSRAASRALAVSHARRESFPWPTK
jgi:hypothetical protein